jgi:hypothetical protein
MGTRPSTAKIAWWVAFPFLVGGGAFAFGGIGPGLFAFAASGLSVAMAVRIDRRLRTQLKVNEFTSAQPGRARVAQFRRLWLMALAAVLAGVVTVVISGGTATGTVAAACLVAVGVGGGTAAAVTRRRGGRQ